MHAITSSHKKRLKFVGKQVWVYGRAWREKREARNVCIIIPQTKYNIWT